VGFNVDTIMEKKGQVLGSLIMIYEINCGFYKEIIKFSELNIFYYVH